MLSRRPLFVAIALSTISSFPAVASSLAPTQLEGVRGAFVISSVSQYLPREAKALESELKVNAEAALSKGGLSTSPAEQQYLVIDVSGEALSQCPGMFLLTVSVAFKEPVSLRRAPNQPLPNSAITTWQQAGPFSVSEAEVVSSIRQRVLSSVESFIELVHLVNRVPTSQGR